MKGAMRKGFMHIVEIVIVVLALFFVLFQFINIPPVKTEWSETKLLLMGNDLLYILDKMELDWTNRDDVDAVLSDAIKHGGTRNTTIIYDLMLRGMIKPSIRVGCICRDDASEFQPVQAGLEHFFLNGINYTFSVERIDPGNPVFSHSYDIIVIMEDFFKPTFHPEYVLDDFSPQITSFLRDDRGILVIKNYTAATASPGTLDHEFFGINWSDGLSQAGSLSFPSVISHPNSTYFDVFKYFYNFPNSSRLKTEYPRTLTNLLDPNDKTITPVISSAGCGLKDDNGVCALILNRGMADGSGKTAWLSQFADAASGRDDNNVLLRAIIAWLAGDVNHIINQEDMVRPVISRRYNMMVPAGQIMMWSFDEGSGSIAYDSSGNANHGTINSPAWGNGKAGTALVFDGSNGYVNLANVTGSGITDEITVMAWAKNDGGNDNGWTGSGRYDDIVTKWDCSAGTCFASSWWLGIDYNGHPRFIVINSDGDASANVAGTTVIANTSAWNHVAGIYNGTDLLVYLNGILEGQTSYSGGIHFNASVNVNVGASRHTIPSGFNGTIDNVAVFNKALSEDEIYSHRDFPDQFMAQPMEIVLTLGYIY